MRVQGQQVFLSASDLMRFMSCEHATALDLRFARGEDLVPSEDSDDAQLLQKYGDDHELRYLSALKADGRKVFELSRDDDLATAASKTRGALTTGPDVVFQGALLSPPWGGWSDFLIRVERPSALGPLWHAAGYALGAATALLGSKAAMACTVAVEEVIDAHYARQASALPASESALKGTIETFRREEIDHRDLGFAHGASGAPAYALLTGAIKAGSRLAIWLAERI